MSGTINAKAIVVGTPNGQGGFDYTVTLDNTGSTTIGTFWFGWVPGEDFLAISPTVSSSPAGWSGQLFPVGSGYSILWSANTAASDIPVGGASASFTFSSTETPAQLAANSTLAPSVPSTTSFVYPGNPLVGTGQQFTVTVAGTTEAAAATLTPLQLNPGLFQYTIDLTDTGNTTVGTFWFAWDDVPDQDFMSVQPTNVGVPSGWTDTVTTHLYPGGGTGYGIEWSSLSPEADLLPNGSSASFTFDSTETPAQFAATQQFNDPSFNTTFQSTSSFVYSGTAELTPGGNFIVDVACFRAGTRIRTPSGDVAIETLQPGDPVITANNDSRPVRWTGRHRVDCQRHPFPEQVWPVRVAAGALGTAIPCADLYLSPDHSLLLDGVLVPVKLLINGTSIAREPTGAVTWHHLELDSHDVILAEGAAAETYLDTGDRAKFDGEVSPLVPGVAPPGRSQILREAMSDLDVVVTGPVLAAIRRRLTERARLVFGIAVVEQAA